MTIRSTPLKPAESRSPVELAGIVALVEADMQAVNRLIADRLRSDIALINQMAAYIINSGGKRLRPVTVLLAAGACQQKSDSHINLAAVIEFIHTATLLHDDVVDESVMRRGQASANDLWGNSASVLVGDFLYTRSFEMMVEIGSMRVMEIMSGTTNQVAEGEVLQLINCGAPDTSEERYLDTVRRKTAKLFESAAQLGAVASHQSSAVEEAMARYGLHLGTAFQLIDDVLDYSAEAGTLGKNIGDDLAEGKPTLPLINAMSRGTPAQQAMLRTAIQNGGLEQIHKVQEAIESTGALAYTARRAREQAEAARQALSIIPESPYKQAMLDLAIFAVERNY